MLSAPAMTAESSAELPLQIAHVLAMDLVGYSTFLINEQTRMVAELNRIVRQTARFQESDANGTLIRLPSGDGMNLVFFDDPEAPLECAVQLATVLKDSPEIRLRMGIHSGPVHRIMDVNDRSNVAGAGIDLAQRVMDCGDAGHILLSKRVADDLAPLPRWHGHLHELGLIEVKHGRKIDLVNFFTDEVGNPARPAKCGNLGGKKSNLTTRAESADAIAVLPLENLSGQQEEEFFADGMTEALITDLAKIGGLKVISRGSVMGFKGTRQPLSEIGHSLGVELILEGSVLRSRERVRRCASYGYQARAVDRKAC